MRRTGAFVLLATTLFAANASAEEDVATLLKQLEEEHASLSTQDCVTACKAYASIRRAADKICALEPGPRCTDARAKADDAQGRVRAACPDCEIAAVPRKGDEYRATPPPVDARVAQGGAADSEAAPRRGGCASCNTPGERPTGDLALVLLALLTLARSVGARSRARRS